MNKIVNNKIFKMCIVITILAAALLITSCTLLFWNSSYKVTEVKVTAALVDKVREAQKQGATLKLNKEELDQIISMYFKKEKSVSGITVKAIDGDIANNNLIIYAPVTYKGFNLLLSSEGSLSYENNKLKYKPLYFKVGKINLSKDFVLNKLGSNLKDTITIKDGIIAINKSIMPINIKSADIKDNEILLGIEKTTALEEKLKTIQGNIKEASLSDSKVNNSSSAAANNSDNSSSGQTTSSSQSSSGNKDTSQMDAAIDRISGGLNSAMGSVSTGGQKAVISAMVSAANSMKGNPNANPYAAAGGVRAIYNKLSPKEKQELKATVFSNVNGADINIVSSMIGK